MSSEPMLLIEDISKTYRVWGENRRESTLAATLLNRISRGHATSEPALFEALRDVSFRVNQGDALGIVGRNGAGKSTLLKVINRVTVPDRGTIQAWGRIGSLLEVGAGFHPELTGRENIALSGSIMGMRKAEINRSFDEIVEFSQVERFLDTPVKRYSSGMFVRLAFAVAAHLPAEILLIDEVLAVGDAEFKRRSIERMRAITKEGRTLLFVSHHLPSIEQLCTRAIFLDRGAVTYDGNVGTACELYLDSIEHQGISDLSHEGRTGDGSLRLTKFAPTKVVFAPDEPKEFEFEVTCLRPYAADVALSFDLRDPTGEELVVCTSDVVAAWMPGDRGSKGRLVMHHPWLRPGRYVIAVSLFGREIIDLIEGAATFEVSSTTPYEHPIAESSDRGRVYARFDVELD